MKFRIRIDDCMNKHLFYEWMEKYEKYVIVHHMVNDNPHFHMLLDDPKCDSLQNMRMRVKRWFKVEKSSDYSVKKCDDERDLEYLQYLFNEKHGNKSTLLYSAGYTDDIINECRDKAKTVAEEYAKVSKRKKQITLYDIAEELAEIMKNIEVKRDFYEEEESAHYRVASKEVIKLCKKYRKGMDYNMIIKIMTTYTGIVNEDALSRQVFKYFSERYR